MLLFPTILLLAFACNKPKQEPTAPTPPPTANVVSPETTATAVIDSPEVAAPVLGPLNCSKKLVATIGGDKIWKLDSSKTICFTAGMFIDADGSPNAYCPDNKGLDYTANAGKPGNWFGIVTDADKEPILQKAGDPKPGCYVSPTSLADKTLAAANPKKYVDAETIPYIALSPKVLSAGGVKIGDMAYVVNTANGKHSYAIFADVGPKDEAGEGSIYLAQQLGIPNTSPRNGGAEKDIVYIIFPGSGKGNGYLRTIAEINAVAEAELNKIGGAAVVDCLGL